MAKRTSKKQMIFNPIVIPEAFKLRLEQHLKTWGCYPQAIYVTSGEWLEFEKIVRKISKNSSLCDFTKIAYRGIPVLKEEAKHEIPTS